LDQLLGFGFGFGFGFGLIRDMSQLLSFLLNILEFFGQFDLDFVQSGDLQDKDVKNQ